MTGEDIVKYIGVKKVKYWGQFSRTGKTKSMRKITEWNSTGMRSKRTKKYMGRCVK